jgi:hypothetical protein
MAGNDRCTIRLVVESRCNCQQLACAFPGVQRTRFMALDTWHIARGDGCGAAAIVYASLKSRCCAHCSSRQMRSRKVLPDFR